MVRPAGCARSPIDCLRDLSYFSFCFSAPFAPDWRLAPSGPAADAAGRVVHVQDIVDVRAVIAARFHLLTEHTSTRRSETSLCAFANIPIIPAHGFFGLSIKCIRVRGFPAIFAGQINFTLHTICPPARHSGCEDDVGRFKSGVVAAQNLAAPVPDISSSNLINSDRTGGSKPCAAARRCLSTMFQSRPYGLLRWGVIQPLGCTA